jgi:hypothetical protein
MSGRRHAHAKLLVSLDEQHDELSKCSIFAHTPPSLASGSTDCHNRLLLRPCRGSSKLRHVGLVEWDDVSGPF